MKDVATRIKEQLATSKNVMDSEDFRKMPKRVQCMVKN